MSLEKKEEIIESLQQGKTLTQICSDSSFPSLSTVYRKMRETDELHKEIMKAREVGVYTLLDKLLDDLNKPQDPKYFQQQRELAHHIRWVASKLASGVFGDKQKVEAKTENKITFSWGRPESVEPEISDSTQPSEN